MPGELIIKLINDVAKVVNNDPDMRDLLKVAFIQLQCQPRRGDRACHDLLEQISTAGMEARAPATMKFALMALSPSAL